MNKQQKILKGIISKASPDGAFIPTVNTKVLNQTWAEFNLTNGCVTGLKFNQIYNELIEIDGLDLKEYKLPIGDFIGESCSNEIE